MLRTKCLDELWCGPLAFRPERYVCLFLNVFFRVFVIYSLFIPFLLFPFILPRLLFLDLLSLLSAQGKVSAGLPHKVRVQGIRE